MCGMCSILRGLGENALQGQSLKKTTNITSITSHKRPSSHSIYQLQNFSLEAKWQEWLVNGDLQIRFPQSLCIG